MFLLNKLKSADIWFFSILIGIVVVCVAIYFLIPIINHKVYEERRENLKKREETFRANLKNLKPESVVVEDALVEEVESNDTAEALEENATEANVESLDDNSTNQPTIDEPVIDTEKEIIKEDAQALEAVDDSLEDKKED